VDTAPIALDRACTRLFKSPRLRFYEGLMTPGWQR